MSKRLTTAQLLEHIRYPTKIQSTEELLKDTYWKHDSDRYSSIKSNNPTHYFKFVEFRFVAGTRGSWYSQKFVTKQDEWNMVFSRPDGTEMVMKIKSLELLTLIEDEDELGMVGLMFL